MKKAHSDEEIMSAASLKDKNSTAVVNGKTDIAIDLDDEHGVTHTYVVTFQNDGEDWIALQVSELSSL